jgi:hypothetical protein
MRFPETNNTRKPKMTKMRKEDKRKKRNWSTTQKEMTSYLILIPILLDLLLDKQQRLPYDYERGRRRTCSFLEEKTTTTHRVSIAMLFNLLLESIW